MSINLLQLQIFLKWFLFLSFFVLFVLLYFKKELDGMHNRHTAPIYGNNSALDGTSSTITNHRVNLSDTEEVEWIQTLNYTVDYGDKTCVEYTKGNKQKKTLTKLLERWTLISEWHGIPYFLVYGSLIGAVRNADFIPWDHDMDILVDETYYEILRGIDNFRNFVPSASDLNYHLVVQNFFRSEYSNQHKPRQNCLGQVNLKLSNV